MKIKQQIPAVADNRERGRLKRKLKELQYLQLWHIEQLSIIQNEKND